jgi:hypothetical protein
MSGIGGFATRLNGVENFNINGNTSATAVSDLTRFIGEVTSISLPELGMTDIDVSSFDSASNFMEFVGGSVDPGVIDIELNYDKAEDNLLLLALRDPNEVWQITFSDSSIWKSDGYINKIGGGTSSPNDKISRVVSIKCSGVPTQSASFIAPPAPTPAP